MLEDRVGSGILVGFGHRIVDNERPHPDAALGLQFRQFAVEAVRRERVLPALEELAVVDRLEALDARAGDAGAGARAFEVNDFRGRLHDGAVAALPHLEAEIRIFVIKRAVILVKLAELAEQARLDHQGRAGHVVRVAHIAKARIRRILVAAPIPSVAEAPHDPAAFLQPAVREQQFRAGDPDFWVALHPLCQLIDQLRIDQRFITLDVDDVRDAVQFRRDLGNSIAPAVVTRIR